MANLLVDDKSLISVADAIRTKGGTSEQLVFPEGFNNAITNISTGGSSQVTIPVEIFYLDKTSSESLILDAFGGVEKAKEFYNLCNNSNANIVVLNSNSAKETYDKGNLIDWGIFKDTIITPYPIIKLTYIDREDENAIEHIELLSNNGLYFNKVFKKSTATIHTLGNIPKQTIDLLVGSNNPEFGDSYIFISGGNLTIHISVKELQIDTEQLIFKLPPPIAPKNPVVGVGMGKNLRSTCLLRAMPNGDVFIRNVNDSYGLVDLTYNILNLEEPI